MKKSIEDLIIKAIIDNRCRQFAIVELLIKKHIISTEDLKTIDSRTNYYIQQNTERAEFNISLNDFDGEGNEDVNSA